MSYLTTFVVYSRFLICGWNPAYNLFQFHGGIFLRWWQLVNHIKLIAFGTRLCATMSSGLSTILIIFRQGESQNRTNLRCIQITKYICVYMNEIKLARENMDKCLNLTFMIGQVLRTPQVSDKRLVPTVKDSLSYEFLFQFKVKDALHVQKLMLNWLTWFFAEAFPSLGNQRFAWGVNFDFSPRCTP